MKENLPEKPTYEGLEQRVQSLEQELAHLRHIKQALTGSEQIAHDASLELSVGLCEVFEALVAMSLGDPHVRVSEESSLELMAKLKRHVNRTAQNLEEIVTLSHEFAMGLAEHFDVLHRVSQGDLKARVTGKSSVEILEALKKVTNKMIESVAGEIAKREHTEEALQAERERLFSLLDGLPMYVYLQGRDHTIRFANRCFKEHFGVPDGRPCYEVIGSTDRPCAACRPFTVFDTGKPLEWEWQRGNGKTYQIYDYPFTDSDGTPLVLELGIDITERKRAQRERQAMEQQFHQAQKMEALGILAGSIVHDFNNLLMVIQSDASMMLMHTEPDDPNSERLKNIQQEVRNGARLLEQLLGFARTRKSEVKTR
jgi:PAS domain-containing protein